MRTARRTLALGTLALFLVAPGCGTGGPSRGTVQGTVTLDGQPVPTGAIRFVPADGAAPTTGSEVKDGQYRAEVPLGTMRVEITAPKVVGQRKAFDTPDSPLVNITEESVPPRYNTRSELTLTVQPGVNTRDFALQSK